ncbi:hypothetical protein EVAR_34494_1 [Eumeta japonica]|uniref:Uncharacterized protein n=1 Tax=Eumeta variegata TaxID=151549 RepID=A0A4C1WXZ3_EUMVA|nr:hypothetical protein EVAR_34494_1 [Eumeta japonica]
MTTGHRKDPPNNVSNDLSTENIKVLLSVISSIDIGELPLLAKKFKLDKDIAVFATSECLMDSFVVADVLHSRYRIQLRRRIF